MPKTNIKKYRRKHFYHGICHNIYDIMVWNGNDQKEKYRPMYHVCKYILGESNCTQSLLQGK